MSCRKSTQKACSSGMKYCIFAEDSYNSNCSCNTLACCCLKAGGDVTCICICRDGNGKILCCVKMTKECKKTAEGKTAGGCACKRSECFCQGKKTSCCDRKGCNCGAEQKDVRKCCCGTICQCSSVGNEKCCSNEAKDRSCVCCYIQGSGECVCVAYGGKNCSDCGSTGNTCKCIKKCCASVEVTCSCCNNKCLGKCNCNANVANKTKCDSGKVECYCCKEKCLEKCICDEKNEAGCKCCNDSCNCVYKGVTPKYCTPLIKKSNCDCCENKCFGGCNCAEKNEAGCQCCTDGCKCADKNDVVCKCCPGGCKCAEKNDAHKCCSNGCNCDKKNDGECKCCRDGCMCTEKNYGGCKCCTDGCNCAKKNDGGCKCCPDGCKCAEKNDAGCKCCTDGCNYAKKNDRGCKCCTGCKCTNLGVNGDKPKCCTSYKQACNCCNKKCLGESNDACGTNGCKCAAICKCENTKCYKGNNDCNLTKCNCVTNIVTEDIDDEACKDCVCNGNKKCGKDGCACEPIVDSTGDGFVNVEDIDEEKTEVGNDRG